MNARTVLTSAFQRRLAKAVVRRRIVPAPTRSISSSAVVYKQRAMPPKSDPHGPAALSSLLARLSLPPKPELHQAVLACLTHPSFTTAEPGAEPNPNAEEPTNELLASLGNTLLGLYASEFLAAKYPHLPANALQAAVTAHVGPASCLSVGRELGLGVVGDAGRLNARANAVTGTPIRWKRVRPSALPEGVETPVAHRFRDRAAAQERRNASWEEGVASVVRAFVGLVYQEQGVHAAREFVHAYFMSRYVDMASIFNFRQPKTLLSNVVSKHLADAGAPASAELGVIQSRVLASSGVNTQAPLFNIGLFLPNGLKLAEGHGSSLAMAEHRAAVNGLLSLFLVRKDGQTLPTSVHPSRPLAENAGGVSAGSDENAFTGLQFGREAAYGLGRRSAARA